MFTVSEKRVIAKLRREIYRHKEYNFWFVYADANEFGFSREAIDYEGGYDLPKNVHFRNTYTIPVGLYRRVIKTALCGG